MALSGKAEGQTRLPSMWRTGRPEDVDLCLHSHRRGDEGRLGSSAGKILRVQMLAYTQTDPGQPGFSQMLA